MDATEYFAYTMHKGGSIVNIASIYGIVGSINALYKDVDFDMPPIYAAAKGGIIAHSRDIATKYAKYGVRVNCVSPGGVYDESRHPPQFEKAYSERTPMGRMATPEDIAWPVAFLASDAAQYITGQNIIVDGGWTAW
ncbi:MAG: SDR family oxidoreductase [Dehalococcoidia bacterium]|nr:MAG: SDR family oxidoreductase [Dehalococcoidia bacterium]